MQSSHFFQFQYFLDHLYRFGSAKKFWFFWQFYCIYFSHCHFYFVMICFCHKNHCELNEVLVSHVYFLANPQENNFPQIFQDGVIVQAGQAFFCYWIKTNRTCHLSNRQKPSAHTLRTWGGFTQVWVWGEQKTQRGPASRKCRKEEKVGKGLVPRVRVRGWKAGAGVGAGIRGEGRHSSEQVSLGRSQGWGFRNDPKERQFWKDRKRNT